MKVTTKIKKSTNGIYHLITDEDYYMCIRAVGKHSDYETLDFHQFTMLMPKLIDGAMCKRCLNIYVGNLKEDRKYLDEAMKVKRKRLS